MHLAAVRADRAADGLAVRGRLRQQPRHGGLPGPAARRCSRSCLVTSAGQPEAARGQRGEVAVQRLVQSPRVRLGEDAAERALARRPDQPGPRVPPPAQDGQRLLGAARRPVSDGRRGVMPGRRERAHRQRQHELQRVPAAQRRARVWDQGQPFTQASARSAVIGENGGTSRHGGRQSAKIAARARYFPETGMVGTSDLQEPCPHVKPVIQRQKPAGRRNLSRPRGRDSIGRGRAGLKMLRDHEKLVRRLDHQPRRRGARTDARLGQHPLLFGRTPRSLVWGPRLQVTRMVTGAAVVKVVAGVWAGWRGGCQSQGW